MPAPELGFGTEPCVLLGGWRATLSTSFPNSLRTCHQHRVSRKPVDLGGLAVWMRHPGGKHTWRDEYGWACHLPKGFWASKLCDCPICRRIARPQNYQPRVSAPSAFCGTRSLIACLSRDRLDRSWSSSFQIFTISFLRLLDTQMQIV
jgi:hypothetical protein